MRSNNNFRRTWDRSERPVYFTFMNNGVPFVFRTDKMTRHPYVQKGATMLKVHSLLTLEGQNVGDNMEILDTRGKALSRDMLLQYARTGRVEPVER